MDYCLYYYYYLLLLFLEGYSILSEQCERTKLRLNSLEETPMEELCVHIRIFYLD